MFANYVFIYTFASELEICLKQATDKLPYKQKRRTIKAITIMNATKVLEDLKRRFPNEPEYHQAVEEVLGTIEEEYNKHP